MTRYFTISRLCSIGKATFLLCQYYSASSIYRNCAARCVWELQNRISGPASKLKPNACRKINHYWPFFPCTIEHSLQCMELFSRAEVNDVNGAVILGTVNNLSRKRETCFRLHLCSGLISENRRELFLFWPQYSRNESGYTFSTWHFHCNTRENNCSALAFQLLAKRYGQYGVNLIFLLWIIGLQIFAGSSYLMTWKKEFWIAQTKPCLWGRAGWKHRKEGRHTPVHTEPRPCSENK